MFQPVASTLNPEEFVVAPHVAALDEFKMTNADGSFAADITPAFLKRFVEHMNAREADTGDLSPLVIGHTMDGLPETEQPPIVGFARNWHLGTLGSTNRACAFFAAWIYKTQAELAKKYPRRSCEVWASRYEADPISLLGATTPARDLGLMKLSREGSITYYPPGDMNVPDEKETGKAKTDEGMLQQILAALTELTSLVKGGGSGAATQTDSAAAAPAAAAPGAEAAPGAPAAGGEMSDEEYNQLLQELLAGGGQAGAEPTAPKPEESRAGEEKTKNQQEPAKMSRTEQELARKVADLEAEVTRAKVRDRLVKLSRPDVANPEDEALVADLVAMAPDARERQFDRIGKTPMAPGTADSFHLSRAVDSAVSNQGGRKRMTQADSVRLSRKASAEKKTFEQVAGEEGFDLYS